VRNASSQVTSMADVVATGITANGGREVLGLDVGDSEDEVFWRGFLTDLKRRGLTGLRLVISDQHAGLVAALRRCFQKVAHQRCRVHFARNLLALVPKSHKDMVAAVFRTIFAQPDAWAVACGNNSGLLLARTGVDEAGVVEERSTRIAALRPLSTQTLPHSEQSLANVVRIGRLSARGEYFGSSVRSVRRLMALRADTQ
jgi:hypothetical protein